MVLYGRIYEAKVNDVKNVSYFAVRPPQPPSDDAWERRVYVTKKFLLIPRKSSMSGKWMWFKHAYKRISNDYDFIWKFTTEWYSEVEYTKHLLEQ